MDAVERKDKATIEKLVAEDFFVTSPGDLAETRRAEWIGNCISIDWQNPKFSNVRVNVYGNTAVVTSLFDFKASGGKVPFPLISNAQMTDIWQRRDGQWQITARHLGAYSIDGYLRLAVGFVAGLILGFLIWLILKLRKRYTSRKKLPV